MPMSADALLRPRGQLSKDAGILRSQFGRLGDSQTPSTVPSITYNDLWSHFLKQSSSSGKGFHTLHSN